MQHSFFAVRTKSHPFDAMMVERQSGSLKLA
jgi:hypothetical protein